MNKSSLKRARALPALVGAAAIAAASVAAAKNWSGWSAPVSIEALPGSSSQLNTPAVDGCPSLSPDGLELYLTSNRAGTLGGVDIWVARRASTTEGFGAPENLGASINSSADEFCATMTPSGRLYFSSRRTDAQGDLYVARFGADGWSNPDNLGPNVNSSGIEESAAFYEDEEGRQVLYFSSNRSGRDQIYYSIDFGPASLAPGGVNSSAVDKRPSVRKDGLEIVWDSTRFGTLGSSDVWTARRSSTSDPWGTAVHLAGLSSPAMELRPFLSRDGSNLLVGSTRAGGEGAIDTYIATREQVTGS